MRLHRILIAAFAVALAAPVTLDAQVAVRAVSRGMLGIMTESVPAGSANATRRVVVEIVPGAPAERAGLVRGDTILTVNGAPATQRLMDAGFEPGQNVELRVRRNGRERTVSIVAAERTGYELRAQWLPDSLLGRMSVIMNAVRAEADTMAFKGRYLWIGGDSTFGFRAGRDSANTFMFRAGGDSTFVFGPGDSTFMIRWRGSLDPARLDSLRTRVFELNREWPRMFADSLLVEFAAPGGNMFRWERDTIGDAMRPAHIFTSSFSAGMRAVAGAELSELNADLAQYFGATGGVLVLNAREDTPAARAGLRAGDVILRAGEQHITSIAELRRAIDRAPRGAPVALQVLRRGQTLNITLGQQR